MKLVRYSKDGGGVRVGVVEAGVVYDAGTSLFEATRGAEVGPLSGVTLHSPLDAPEKIICVGLNYRDHAEEAGLAIPSIPNLFSKFNNSLVGPGENILVPAFTDEVDYEAELGVVIGRRASYVSAEEALDYVFGYTCVNDVSSRDVQFAEGNQWLRGKTLDTFCPVGPWIVTSDEVPDPQALGIRCVVNGQTLQKSSTDQMVWSVAELVSFISQGIVLQPGDLISTGTPSGVGFKRTPPVFLRDGDVVRIEIDGVGDLENPVAAVSA